MIIRDPLTGRQKKIVQSLPQPIIVVRKYFSASGPRMSPRISGEKEDRSGA